MSQTTQTSRSNVPPDTAVEDLSKAATTAAQYAHQAEKLSHVPPKHDADGAGTAIQADYVTPQDTVVVTANGGRLPGVPLTEAAKLAYFSFRTWFW